MNRYLFKIMTVMIVLLASMTILSSGAFADEQFEIDWDGTITYYHGSDTALVIPQVVMKEAYDYTDGITKYYVPVTVTAIGNLAFQHKKSLTTVSIPSGVISIGELSFIGCTNLTSISLPESLTTIGNNAFFECSSLTNISLPSSVTSIGQGAFSRCKSLKNMVVPSGVTSIESSTFSECSSLTDITIPERVTSIGDWAFSFCSSLTNISIPEKATTIGDWAFADCSNLTSINIPDNVTNIGAFAFNRCSSLTSISIPEGITSIGDSTFGYCSGLTSLTIPNSVTSIGEFAFAGCSSLTSLEIPDSVTIIGNEAFRDLESLTSLIIPDSVTTIGDGAFRGIPNITDVTIPNNLTSISNLTFAGCGGLTSIIIPESVTNIGSEAFNGCMSLTSLTIPEGVTHIANYAFLNCYSLEKAVFLNREVSIDGDIFMRKSVVIHCYRDSTADIMAQTYGYEVVYLDDENSIELKTTGGKKAIDAFTYACGSFLFDSDDCTELELHYSIDKTDNSDACEFTITLPDGFSFEEYSVVQTKDFTKSYNAEGKIKDQVTVYPLYSSVCPDELVFEISGQAEHTETVPVTRAQDEGVVLCRNTKGVAWVDESVPIRIPTNMDYVEMFLNTSVNTFSDRLNELGCALSFSSYIESFIRDSLENLGFTKVKYEPSLNVHDVASVLAMKKNSQRRTRGGFASGRCARYV